MTDAEEKQVRDWFARTRETYEVWLSGESHAKDRAARVWLRTIQERILAAARSGSFQAAEEAYSDFCEVLEGVPEGEPDNQPTHSRAQWTVPQSPGGGELMRAAQRLDDLARAKGAAARAAGQVMLFAFAPSGDRPLKRRHLLDLQAEDRRAALCLIEEAAKRGKQLPNIWRVRRV